MKWNSSDKWNKIVNILKNKKWWIASMWTMAGISSLVIGERLISSYPAKIPKLDKQVKLLARHRPHNLGL